MAERDTDRVGECEPRTLRRRGLCLDCRHGDHVSCIDAERSDCGCQCVAWIDCDTCDSAVILMADDPDDTSYSHGECCTWGYVDTFDGCIRLDLSGATNG